MQSIFFGAAAPADQCVIAEAVTMLHEAAGGRHRSGLVDPCRPMLHDEAAVDAICALAAGNDR